VPEHIWKDYAEAPASTEFENVGMIGTGPFKMLEYKQNEFVRLGANQDHFASVPKIDEAIFQTFESDDVLVQSLTSGQMDMITEMPATAVETLKGDANIQVVTGAPFAPAVSDIIFNQADPENCPTDVGGLCTGHPALRDRNVRLALAHATDKQKLIDIVLLGFGAPGLTLIPDGLGHWYNDTLTDFEFDVAKANQILDDAGYADSDSDGVREMPDGSQPLNFRMHWPSDSIDATSEIPNGYNETGYSNPAYDELYEQQGIELDLEKRRALVWQMQQIVFEDVVYVIPFYEQAIQAYRVDKFTGWITDKPKIELSDVSSLLVIEPVK